MGSPRYQRVSDVFEAVCDLSQNEQTHALDGLCGDDSELRHAVEALIRRDEEQDDSFLQTPALGDGFDLQPISAGSTEDASLVGSQIHHYRLTRLIGSGGMGAVYEAQQDEPRRKLAVKVMRRGISSASALKRFEYESQILGYLRHPGIAHVYEAGRHPNKEGVPYFAMEYVSEAQSIIAYAQAEHLGTGKRIELFVSVCDAVHYGHQKGVIHRDLKPSNILVDRDGMPKVIDFGVALVTDSDLALTTLQTDVGTLVGTLQYMSPEQCEAQTKDLDTRSDVYSLGVVLYELLCDRRPYDVSGKTVAQAMQTIREALPTPLSTITRSLRGDLETIVHKALEKDRSRRYDSVASFSADLQRYLKHEPIIARPASAAYHISKFARRNKGLVIASSIAFAALVSALVVSLNFAAGESRALRQAEIDRNDARRQAHVAKAATRFLSHDVIAAIQNDELNHDVTLREVLDAAAEKVATTYSDEPLHQSVLRNSIGTSFQALGLYAKAEEQFVEALRLSTLTIGPDDIDTIIILHNVGVVVAALGRPEQAMGFFEQALEGYLRTRGPDDESTLAVRNDIARALRGLGRYEEAEIVVRNLVQIHTRLSGNRSKATLFAKHALAALLKNLGRRDEARDLNKEILPLQRELLGDEHEHTQWTMDSIAEMESWDGHYAEAAVVFEQLYHARTLTKGPEHRDTLGAHYNFAFQLAQLGRYEEAKQHYEEVIEIAERTLGPGNYYTLTFKAALAQNLLKLGFAEESIELYRAVAARAENQRGKDHPNTIVRINQLGSSLVRVGQAEEAVPMLEDVVANARRVHGEEHPNTITFSLTLAMAYDGVDRLGDAEALFVWAIEVGERVFGADHWRFGATLKRYGDHLVLSKRFDDAERSFLQAHSIFVAVHGEEHPRTGRAVEAIVKLYEAWDKPEQAEQWRAKLQQG